MPDFGVFMSAVGGAGFAAAVAAFLIFQGVQREKAMSDTVKEMQKFQQTELVEMHRMQNVALTQNTAALLQNTAMLGTVSKKLDTAHQDNKN